MDLAMHSCTYLRALIARRGCRTYDCTVLSLTSSSSTPKSSNCSLQTDHRHVNTDEKDKNMSVENILATISINNITARYFQKGHMVNFPKQLPKNVDISSKHILLSSSSIEGRILLLIVESFN